MPEFDAFLMVDWSASSRPVTGADSVWYCLVIRNFDGRFSRLRQPSCMKQRPEKPLFPAEDVRTGGAYLITPLLLEVPRCSFGYELGTHIFPVTDGVNPLCKRFFRFVSCPRCVPSSQAMRRPGGAFGQLGFGAKIVP
jgi:hypothetical protein